MPAINFPASPSINDTFTSSGKTWKWNGTFWELVVSGASVADGSVSTAKIADGAITAAKIADGTIVAAEIANNAITTDKIAAGAVTAAKLGNDIQLTPPDGSITQAKLAASLSGITVTTTANRGTAVPSPFTGQTIYLSDVKRVQIWDGSAWMFVTNGAPGAPTSLSATALSTTSVSVSFTPGESAGASPINYKYSLSTNGGSTYGEPIALDPADITSPVTISGLTGGQTYHIKLRAVSDFGDSPDSTATSVLVPTVPSAPTSLSATPSNTSVEISFTPGADGGSPITNYQYAVSSPGSQVWDFFSLSPVDTTSPITITGLTQGTAYSAKLKAVSAFGAGAESAVVSFTTNITVEYLVVAGGGGGGPGHGGGGGAGGYRTGVIAVPTGTTQTVSIGGGGSGGVYNSSNNTNGANSVFASITSTGGGKGGAQNAPNQLPTTGGSGGGGSYTTGGVLSGAAGNAGGYTPVEGYAGGTPAAVAWVGAGGGGSSGVGTYTGSNGGGGPGTSNSITGTAVTYAVGGNGQNENSGSPGAANTGTGGGGSRAADGAAGGSGVVILRYLDTRTITVGAGLTTSNTNTTIAGGYKYTRITAGSGNVSWA